MTSWPPFLSPLLTGLLVAVFALHVAGAIKHAVIDRDGLMRRMSLRS